MVVSNVEKIIKGINDILKGKQEFIELGNINSKRDWGHTEDYVRGMWQMLQQDDAGDYVVCTGETHSVKEFCEVAFSHLNLHWEDYVKVDENLIRPAEVDLLVGDASKATEFLGWKPEVGFEDLVKMMVDADVALLEGRLKGLS